MAQDFGLTENELRQGRARRRRIAAWITAGALLLVAALFGARPAEHSIKAWQARRHADQAFRAIASEDWQKAGHEAEAAYRLWPSEPQAIRAVARFLSRIRQPEALNFWKALGKEQPLGREDLRDEAAIALLAGESETADAAVERLLGKNEGGPRAQDWLLGGQDALLHGAGERAEECLKKALADPAISEAEQLQASLLQIAAARGRNAQAAAALEEEAWDRIREISRGKSATSLQALTILAQRALAQTEDANTGRAGAINGAERSRIISALEAHPLAKTAQQLLAIDLRIEASPNEKEALLQGAVERWKTGDTDSLIALAKWLNGKGEPERELQSIPLSRAVQNRELFLQHLDALGALGRWADVKRVLTSEGFPLDPAIAQMYLARCNAQLGEKAAASNSWQRALEDAAGDSGKLMTLAEYAEKNGASEIAAVAYDSALEQNPRMRAAWQGKLRLAQARRETKSIHAVLAAMLKIWPNDTAIQNDEAYTRLLLAGEPASAPPILLSSSGQAGEVARSSGGGLKEVEDLARDLIRREPTSLPHRTLLALALLRENRPYTARDIYNDINVPARAATGSAVAVHAAVLAASGSVEAAKEEVAEIDAASLLPEERALIMPLL